MVNGVPDYDGLILGSPAGMFPDAVRKLFDAGALFVKAILRLWTREADEGRVV
jgi:hypothetical protein